ncbi:mediator of RNA polymerase II transcription subunit 17 [Aspergillus bertholletiae]|uniref:Mediator of RNA polymerase II transcription subunit 17 n=1 Tax=Aspergillus bertholletiae TaxID=1226010 RepID=A0A5N7BPQ6_9EURO|nr:mediator of RNA polymerase II transcription subunit 17 [Aspergillus bertholletiae]
MSESFNLPLHPQTEKRERPDPLPVEIAQINAQYGSFRDVTEESLRAKIEADKSKDSWADEEENDSTSADEDTTERLDQLYKRRAAITQFAHQAHMEAMFALDFVSLLLSKHTPRQAEMSMSAYLKQVAPLGSLNSEIVNPPPKPDSAAKDTKNVSRGWRLQNFNSAAAKLLDSATRLEAEAASETNYWNEVLAVKEKGWKVSRLPRERQALGVQYGFLEATPIFRDRGLAALRRTNDGSLILDKGLIPLKARTVRVRVRSGSQITGCSKHRPASDNNESIESRILQARDTVYEEELFHELVREARILGSQGVTTRQNLVQFPVSEGQEVLLDLVDDDQMSPEDETAQSNEHAVVADALAHAIRILLAYAHRQNLRRRTQLPPPLTPKRRQTPEYQLLRPVMAYLQHSSHVRWLESLLNDMDRILKSAGITCDFTATPFSSLSLQRAVDGLPKVEALVQEFLFPYESIFSAQLVTRQSSFQVKVRTNVTTPPLGTHYEVSVNLPQYPDVRPPNRIGLQHEVASVITHFVLLDILTAITQSKGSPVHASGKQDTSRQLTWEAAYPHNGELLALSSTGQCKKMKVSLSRHELTVRAHSVRGIDGVGKLTADKTPAMSSQTWKSDGTPGQLSLMDFIAEVSKE